MEGYWCCLLASKILFLCSSLSLVDNLYLLSSNILINNINHYLVSSLNRTFLDLSSEYWSRGDLISSILLLSFTKLLGEFIDKHYMFSYSFVRNVFIILFSTIKFSNEWTPSPIIMYRFIMLTSLSNSYSFTSMVIFFTINSESLASISSSP